MTRLLRRIVLLAFLFVFGASAASQGGELSAPAVYQKTLRATALVISEKGQGTGWVVDRDKKQLVTNQHVMEAGDVRCLLHPALLLCGVRCHDPHLLCRNYITARPNEVSLTAEPVVKWSSTSAEGGAVANHGARLASATAVESNQPQRCT